MKKITVCFALILTLFTGLLPFALADEMRAEDYYRASDTTGAPFYADIPYAELRVGTGGTMPAWYPLDPSAFPKYHDSDAPRVTDIADIFTDEEEAAMEARLRALRAELGKDIVIITDVSAYGLGQMTYADDFYDFNGYGCGDDYEGVCLFICMDPNDRGWWTSCTGPETIGLYTETAANRIDDALYEYMVSGRYGDGVADWIEQMACLLRTGRVPRSAASWMTTAVIDLVIGAVVGALFLAHAKKKMAAPRLSRSADRYLVPGSLDISRAGDHFLYTSTSRIYDPVEERSSGSGGGRSSYSGSHTSSSGTTHSGSGRKF